MIWKKLLLISMLSILILSACAPTSTETMSDVIEEDDLKEQLKIGLTLPTLQFPFYVRMHDALIEEADKRGWEVVYVDGNLDALTQVNASLDLLTKDIDVLVIGTWWVDAMLDVFENADKNSIPVFLMDKAEYQIPEGSKVASVVGTDPYDAGYVGGSWMAERIKDDGKTSVNMINVTMSDDMPVKRCQGFLAGLQENGIEVNLLNEYLGDTRANSMSSTEDALITYPDGEIDLIFGYSAQASLGAYDACVGANRNEIQIVGFDGEDDEITLIDANSQYIGTIMQYPDEMARKTVELIEKMIIDGSSIESYYPIEAGVYDGK